MLNAKAHPCPEKKRTSLKLLLKPLSKKDISLYKAIGLVQPTDKIVVRFALTIYPYSLGFTGDLLHLYGSIKPALRRRAPTSARRLFGRACRLAWPSPARVLIGDTHTDVRSRKCGAVLRSCGWGADFKLSLEIIPNLKSATARLVQDLCQIRLQDIL